MKQVFSALLITIAIVVSSCKNGSYDPKLQTPDTNGRGLMKGYTLTPLDCLVYDAWEYDLGNHNRYNIALFYNDSQLYSRAATYTLIEANLVFKLDTNFTLEYWTKNDYEKSPVDTVNGGIIRGGAPRNSTNLKNIYKGKWTVDFKDSTLKFDFDDPRLGYPPLEVKYMELGSSRMTFRQTTWIDSAIDNKNVRLKKVITTYLTH
jgi:hypothetical protein